MKCIDSAMRLLRRSAAAVALLAILLALAPKGLAGDAERQYIVKYRSGGTEPFDVVDETEMRRLDRMGALEWFEPDGEAFLTEDPVYFGEDRWNLGMIGADTAFRLGCLGQGVRVGVLDSGINPHPDLRGSLLSGRNYIQDARDPDDTSDSYGHGTRVAGLVSGAGDDGVFGVAPGAEIVPIKITDTRTVKISTVCRAIYGAIDDFGCRVLNMSLGVQTEYEALKEAVQYAEQKGVVVVSAVGNGGTSAKYYPAFYDSVIGVGAVSSAGTVYTRSNHNQSVLLTAPGVDVRSTASRGGYADATGTSFSVPHVSGAAAVLLGINPALKPADMRALLAETASDRGAEGYDEYYGYGILNLADAVLALDGGEERRAPCRFLPEEGPADTLRNETDAPIRCTYLLAGYDGFGVCRSVLHRTVTLPAHGSVALETPDSAGPWAQFVCEADTMLPLSEARTSGGPGADPPPDSSASAEEGFYHVGEAAGVTVEPRNAAGAVEPVSGAYPGSDRLRVVLSGTRWGAQYLLTVSEAETGKVFYADQHAGGGTLRFDVAFPLPEHRTDLVLSVGSTAEGFAKTTVSLSYLPAVPVPVPDYVNCDRREACPLSAYADLDAGVWYHDGVHWALRTGVMNGVGAERFAPDGSTSRAMLVTMLWRLEGMPAVSYDMTFADVSPDAWYTEAIRWAAAQGIVEGYSAERFGGSDPISREQLATILWRFAGFKGDQVETDGGDPLGQYLDAEKISAWALEAMRWAISVGLVKGVGAERLSPGSGATRAQTATVLMRFDALTQGDESPFPFPDSR